MKESHFKGARKNLIELYFDLEDMPLCRECSKSATTSFTFYFGILFFKLTEVEQTL